MRPPSADRGGIGGHKGSATSQELAEQFGVSSSTLERVRRGNKENNGSNSGADVDDHDITSEIRSARSRLPQQPQPPQQPPKPPKPAVEAEAPIEAKAAEAVTEEAPMPEAEGLCLVSYYKGKLLQTVPLLLQ